MIRSCQSRTRYNNACAGHQESKLHAKYNKLLDKYVFEWDMCRNMERFADEY